MTLILAISAKDRIVVASDGLSENVETGEITPDMPKIFRLSDYAVAMVAGEGLENIEKFMKIAEFSIAQNKNCTFNDVLEYMNGYLETRTWAGTDNAHILMLLAGYNDDLPQIHVLGVDTKDSHKKKLRMYSLGNWEGSNQYLLDKLGDTPIRNTEFRLAEKTAICMVALAEKARPQDIGGQEQLWHVFPDRIEEKTSGYTSRLRKKYTKALK